MYKTLFDNDTVLPKSESQKLDTDSIQEAVEAFIAEWPSIRFESEQCVILARDNSGDRLVISKNRITV